MAYLSSPYYQTNVPNYLLYGSIGQTLAHELLHSLDTKGHTLTVNNEKTSLWTAEDLESYNSYETCLSDSYLELFHNVTLKKTFYADVGDIHMISSSSEHFS
jgi:predicted metalloendopeptidase